MNDIIITIATVLLTATLYFYIVTISVLTAALTDALTVTLTITVTVTAILSMLQTIHIACRLNAIHAGGVGHLVQFPLQPHEPAKSFRFAFLPPRRNQNDINQP